jgi:16S rRNA (cytidine1402-2'-O)-methyltransferase
MIFYESPYRLVRALDEMAEVFGNEREASVSREISKLFEENLRGSLESLSTHYKEKPPKGEIIIIVSGKHA